MELLGGHRHKKTLPMRRALARWIESVHLSVSDLCIYLCVCLVSSELGGIGSLELELQLVCDEGDELGIGGLSLCVGNRVAEKSLQSIQIASVPGHLDGVADGPLHPAGLQG